jgi:hypothetical protein
VAAAYSKTRLERVSAQLTGDVTNPYRLVSTWTAIDLVTGELIETAVPLDLPTTDPLIQGQWDAVFSQVNTDFAAVTGGTGPTVNPVVV